MITVKLSDWEIDEILHALDNDIDPNFSEEEDINKRIIRLVHKLEKTSGLQLTDYTGFNKPLTYEERVELEKFAKKEQK